MVNKKIALFGGSFNPVHNQHINLINEILNQDLVDEVWIIPSKNHPHSKQLTPAKDRVNMIKLAISNPKVKICDIELKSDETNYTIRTITKLKAKYPHEFFWTMGSDILQDMNDKWYGIKELMKATKFIIFKRKGYSIKKIPNMKIIAILENNINNISSSEIRKRIAQNKSLKDLIPLPIKEYILKNKLYK